MVGLVLTLCLATPAPRASAGSSAKWLRLLQPRRVERGAGQGAVSCPDKAALIALSRKRVEEVPQDLDALAGIQSQATADRERALPGNVLDAMHGAFLGGRNRLTTLAAHEYAWSAALSGVGPLDHHARVRVETSAGPRFVRVHLTGDRDEPEISVEIESSDRALEEDHIGAVGARLESYGSSPSHALSTDLEGRFTQVQNFLHPTGPRPDRTATGRVREDGTFDIDRAHERGPNATAEFEDRLHVSGRIRDDGLIELWSLDRKYVLDGVPLSNYAATADGIAHFEQPGAAVPPRSASQAGVQALVGPMARNRWSSGEILHQLNHTDFLHGATDHQLVQPPTGYLQQHLGLSTGIALFGNWIGPKYIGEQSKFPYDSSKMTVLAVAPMARAVELVLAGNTVWGEPSAPTYVSSAAEKQLALHWAKRFLTGAPVRADLVTADTVPSLARMALAAGIPFDDVKVSHAGAVIPLTFHPSFPREARDLAAEEQFLDERLVALGQLVEQRGAATVAESEVRALLFDGPRFHFGDVVSQVIFNRELWGAHLPEDASATPPAFEDEARGEAFARELFQELRHPGAAAVLCGLLTRVPEAALRRALSAAGSHDAEVWARIGAGLQRFPSRLVPYVLSDLLVDPEHRHLDAAVLDVRVRALQTLMDLRDGRAAGDALEALGHQVASESDKRGTAILARALVDDAPFFSREGSLTRAALIEFFEERMHGIAETQDRAGTFFAPEFPPAREERRW